MSVRVVVGIIQAKDVTTRMTIPTPSQPRWPPFERVAETIAAPRRRFPPHRHEGAEVLSYAIEGMGLYSYGSDAPVTLTKGSVALLTAPSAASHGVDPEQGRTFRWFAAVVAMPSTVTGVPRIQVSNVPAGPVQADGTAIRRLVGPGAPITSAAGLEAEVIEFRDDGTTFRRIGHDRVATVYALAGRGAVDSDPLEVGESALVSEAAGIGIQGRPGFHVIMLSAPRMA